MTEPSLQPAPALPPEEVLEPDLEIIDPHHHLWDHIEPAYLLDDLLADTASGHRVTETVYVECGWRWDETAHPRSLVPLPEVSTVTALAAESRRRGGARIAGIVGPVDLRLGSEAGRTLDEARAIAGDLLVGVRQASAWDESDQVIQHRTRPGPGLLASAAFGAGLAEVASRGLTFDAWLYHPQLAELTGLAGRFPDTRFVLDHLGGPLSMGPYLGRAAEVERDWRASMRELARRENVVVKLGGVGMAMMLAQAHRRARPLSSAEIAREWGPRLLWCIETFGVDRCMFESNFPVDRATCSYRMLWNAFKLTVSGASIDEKAALFRGTAQATYGLRKEAR